jgi:hypothetical protein
MYHAVVRWFDLVAMSVVTVIALAIAFPSRSRLERERRGFLERTRAHMDPSFVEAFDRESRRMARLMGVFLVVFTAVLLGVTDRFYATGPPPDVNLWLATAPVVAAALTLYPVAQLHSVDRLFRVPGRTSAVARPVRVTIADYVGPWTRALTWTIVVMAVGIAVLLAVLAGHGKVDTSTAAVSSVDAGLALGLMLLTEWFGRILAARPTPAVDASHLYLQDAWRASVLSRAHANVGYICHVLFYGLIFTFTLPDWFYNGPALGLVCLLSSAYPLLRFVQPRQFRQRLWRGLAPTQVLLPGQTVAPGTAA